ncbi:MAG: imidazolonepropionase [Candidatus Eisenbacteria bacterium]|nr:imidazolonepropionase [Candidatus Latescibacterota bacterium]MBD3301079.1 imidazolonepropionase [Candidatus Eisenbacteria bacterium]
MSGPARADLLLHSIRRLVTVDPHASGGDGGPLGVIENGAVAITGDRIAAVGPTETIRRDREGPETEIRALPESTVLPGFVDPHTHVLFAGSREEEFALRLEGRSYMEIAAAGGGILSSVRSFRAATDERILEETRARLDAMLALGTTTVEVKSGYGLETEQEIRALRLIDRLNDEHPCDLIGTFLGAHEFPPEHRDRRAEYVRIVAEEMLPRVAAETRARYCDVFCEKGVYTPEESRAILVAARSHGLRLRVHADEFAPSGASELAGELGADSADHLMEVTDAGLAALAAAGTTAVLLPGTSFSMGNRRYADPERIRAAGVQIALATDCNPGSAMTHSMPLILTLAVLEMKMPLAEAIRGATTEAARSLGIDGEVGQIAPGRLADLQVLPAPHEAGIVYRLGGLVPSIVYKRGRPVSPSAAPFG